VKKLCLLLVCLVLAGCGTQAVSDPFADAFSCTVDCTLGEIGYTLAYTKTAKRETLHILAPETLCGLSAVREDGNVTVTHADLTFQALAGERLFDFAKCFAPRAYTVAREGDGYRLTADGYTLYTDTAGLPLRLTGGRYDLQFRTFEGDENQ